MFEVSPGNIGTGDLDRLLRSGQTNAVSNIGSTEPASQTLDLARKIDGQAKKLYAIADRLAQVNDRLSGPVEKAPPPCNPRPNDQLTTGEMGQVFTNLENLTFAIEAIGRGLDRLTSTV